MKRLFICTACTFLFISLFAQIHVSENPQYIKNVTLGEEALNNEHYDSCMVYYRKAFSIKQTSVLSTLRMAACAYSGGYNYAFHQKLNQAIELNWGMAKTIFDNYTEFSYLKNTPFESLLLEKARKAAVDEGINLELMDELEYIRNTDQAQRQEMGNFEWGTPSMDSLWKIQSYSDSINTIKICEIIDEYGYPGKSLVGGGQMGTAFLVIQHADLEVQERYLPIIKEAANNGEVRWSSLALLIDRVNLRKGSKQIYGSQIARTEDGEHYVSPIEEPYKVDSLRASVGLGKLNDYTQNWNFDWDVERHIKLWAELEKMKAQNLDK
jgi:hypothetical protein